MIERTGSDLCVRNLPQFDTFLDCFFYREKTMPDEVYLRQPTGNEWREYTWAEVGQEARRIASALKALGLPPKSHVGLLSKNCAHWIIADLAILMSGYVSVPYAPPLAAEQLNEVISLSNIRALFVGKLEQWALQQAGVPDDIPCIAFPHYPHNSRIEGCLQWEALLTQHAPLTDAYIPDVNDLFTIIYTSGTTGTPKGVMLTYANPQRLIDMEQQHHAYKLFQGAGTRMFSYLPLNHIAERTVTEIASIYAGGTVSFVESSDTFVQNLCDTQPTLFFAVPHIWTKFQLGILDKTSQNRLDILLRLPFISSLIKQKIKAGLGLNQAITIISSSGLLPVATAEWFRKLDIPIQIVYGMSEACGGVTYTPNHQVKLDTVGIPLSGCEIKIDDKTSEILIRTPWLMQGYYNDPEKTEQVLQDGYLHTGDQGKLDQDGYLKLIGRVKDTFKSAKGEYILPAPLEEKFADNHDIELVCVVGMGLPQPIALVNLSSLGQAVSQAAVSESLQATLWAINAGCASYEKIKKIVIIQEPWTIENGVLTPTLKLKRNMIDARYRMHYEPWYERNESLIWV